MFLITCPWCGERDQSEFSCGGQAHIVRPIDNDEMSDEAWADYLFMRKNTKGLYYERWVHACGCGQWFNMVRNTVNDEILGSYKIGESPPHAA